MVIDYDMERRLKDSRTVVLVLGMITLSVLIAGLCDVVLPALVFLTLQVVFVSVRFMNLSADIRALHISQPGDD